MMEKLRRFLGGRYGTDSLGIALVIASMAVALVARIAGSAWVQIPAYMLLIWELFRMLSKNAPARRRENAAFQKLWKPVQKWFKLQYNRVHDFKTHRYYSCPNCKNTLRVPRGKGQITITCPVCKNKFDKKT